MRRTWLLLPLAFTAMICGIFAYRVIDSGRVKEVSRIHNFALPGLEGNPHNIDEWKGSVLVINFWATWCAPCREEIPLFIQLQQTHGEQGIQFIGIAIEDAEPVQEFVQNLGMNYPVLIAGMGGLGLSNALGNRASVVPFSVVVNRNGEIVHTEPGIFSLEEIQDHVLPLL